jgi:hypothetical protein
VGQLGKGNISWGSDWAGADGLGNPNVPSIIRLVDALRNRSSAFPAGLEQDAALLATIGWGRGQAPCHGGQPPFLHIGFNEYEAHLAKIDMNGAGTIGPNCWKQILGAVVVGDILQLLAIASKEDCPRARSVADADDIALEERGAIRCRCEWLVVSAVAGGLVGNRRFVEA